MPFEVAVVNKLGKHVLHKGWNRAGVEAEFFLVKPYEMLGKNHIPDA